MSDIADDWPYMRDLRAGVARIEAEKTHLQPVVSLIESQADVDFLRRLTATVLFAEAHKVGHMVVVYRKGNPLRTAALSRARGIKTFWEVEADAPALGLIDWFDVGWDAPASCANEDWKELGLGDTNLILHHKLLDRLMAEVQPRRPALGGWQPGNGGPVLADGDLIKEPEERLEALVASSGLITADPLNRALAGALGIPVALLENSAGSPWFEGDVLATGSEDRSGLAAALAAITAFAETPEHRTFEVVAGETSGG